MNKLINKKGFSFVELVVVLGIIGTLAGAVALSGETYAERQKVSKAKGELMIMQNAIERYRLVFGGYPASLADIPTSTTVFAGHGSWPTKTYSADPWGTTYQYEASTGYVYSLGKDKTQNAGTDKTKRQTGPGDIDAFSYR